ncbi:purine and uridine phosphorylase, partial [Aureobasidium melanogenum]
MRLPLDQWLEHAVAQEHGALPQHTQILKTVIQDKISPENAAKELVDNTSSSRDEEDTAYRLWNLLFHTAANLPSHITAIVDLTLAIYDVPPSPQVPNALSYNLWTSWQDIYSYYHTYRTLASPASADTLTNADRWINFTCFSATLLNQSNNEMFVREIGINAFFDLRNALEMTLETHAGKTLLQNSAVTAEQVMEIDAVAAAKWVLSAGDKPVHLDNEMFGEKWRRELSQETELWDATTIMSDPHQYTVGWICAIPAEGIAASLFLDEEHERLDHVSSNDCNDYTLGKMAGHNVVIAVLPDGEYGLTSATGVVKDMLSKFPNIRVGLMVGVGGGAPTAQNDIRLGDVVVSSSKDGISGVYQYDYGKLIRGYGFRQTGFLNQASIPVRAAVSGLRMQYKKKGHMIDETIKAILHEFPRLAARFSRPREDRDRLYKADFVHPVGNEGGCDDCCGVLPERIVQRRARTSKEDNPAVHHGIIASGNSLMRDASVRDTLASEKGIMCFEMEAAGVMNHLPCLVIRGICDYSDSHKNKEWQGYAAMTAAAYAKDLLARMGPSRVEAEQKVRETLEFIEHNASRTLGTAEDTAACVDDLKADARYHRIYSWLSPSDHITDQNEALYKRHKGTGQWFVRSEVFTAFKEGEVPFLWLSGIPGCGKTILSSSIIEDLQHTSSISSVVLLYFYFDFTDIRKQTLDNALRSLLWQLTRRGESSFREVEQLYESCKDGEHQPSTQSLIRKLDSVLQATGRVTIVLDALDECTTRRVLLEWLAETAAKDASGIQIIATSRKEYDIEVAFTKWLTNDVMLSIQQLEVDKDIQAYVHARIRSDSDLQQWRGKAILQNEIEVKLMRKAQGMFRWAKCQLDSLAECFYLRKLHQVLNMLPTTLDATYARILDDIPPMYLQDTIRLLQILTWSERPLLIEEAVDYLAVELDSEFGFDTGNRLPVPREIMRFCLSLVTVARTNEDTREYLEGTGPSVREEIRLAHYSVKEFLNSGRYQGSELRLQLGQATSAAYVASVSLTYLLQLQTDMPIQAITSEFPLAMYSASYWMDFARVADPEDNRLQILIERLLLVPERCYHWLTLFNPDKPRRNLKHLSQLPQPLYYASLGGLVHVANRLLESGADINSLGGRYDNALQAAAAHGLENMVTFLLQMGADVNAYRGDASTLQVASVNGHLGVVQSLLAHGADVNAEGGDDGHISALEAACFSGHLEVVKLLLNSGADVNIQGGKFGSALQAASLVGCDKIVQLLLDRGADINVTAGFGCGEPLEAAFYTKYPDCPFHGNRENVVLLLLEKCDDLRMQDKRYVSLVEDAAGAGFKNVLKRLLTTDLEVIAREDIGTDTDAQSELHSIALSAASWKGRDNIVQMLLDKGVDVNIKVGQYGSALQAASEAGHAKIVKMLLQNTIYSDVGGTANAAAFDTAFRWGYTDILETLLMSHCKETVADEHGWSSEAYLVLCRGFTSQSMSQHPTRQYDCPTIPLGQTPSRFVETVSQSGLSLSNDGLDITSGRALSDHLAVRIQARADHPIPAGLNHFFFEVEIVCGGRRSLVAIGLCNGSSSKTGMPGWNAGSWAYHGDDGKKFGEHGEGERYSETYGTGDTICCGIDFNSNTVEFYKNGIPLGTAFEGVKGRLFPVIGLGNQDLHLRIRFLAEEFLFPPHASRQVSA